MSERSYVLIAVHISGFGCNHNVRVVPIKPIGPMVEAYIASAMLYTWLKMQCYGLHADAIDRGTSIVLGNVPGRDLARLFNECGGQHPIEIPCDECESIRAEMPRFQP